MQHVAVPAYVEHPLEIKSAKGIYLIDIHGNKYIDLVSGVSVSNLGHAHPAVVQAVKEQAEQHMHLMVYGEFIQSPQAEFAGLLCSMLPEKLQSVFYVNSGSEAIEGALKLAKRVTGRSELIAFKNAYHGSTHGALSVLGNEEMKYSFRPLLPDVRFLDFLSFSALEAITHKTAAVLIEPIQAEAGIIIPPKEYLIAVKNKCLETGAQLIFDEVQMGFGRTGSLFAFQQFDVVPDILCLAKAMGGGMPIGAFVSSKDRMDLLKHHPALGHITTFGGHPVSAAAALASLKTTIDEDLPARAKEKGQKLAENLATHPEVVEIRQIGLMLAVELKNEKKADQITNLLLQNRMIVDRFLFNKLSFRIAPPLIISDDEIDLVSQRVLKCLDELK